MKKKKVVSNVQVYGIEESIAASKLPFAVNPEDVTPEITKTVKALALSLPGFGEDTFLDGIIVQFDLTFTMKAWTELQRYHFIEFVSSQSTMHRITKFELEDQCNEYVDSRIIEILREKISDYEQDKTEESFYRMMYNIPSGMRLTARMSTDYRQLKTIYRQRRNHRLKPDWGEFCDWIETLPYSEFITGETDG